MSATATLGLKDQLKAIQAEIEENTDAHASALRERESARDSFVNANIPASEITRSPEFAAAEQAVAAVGAIEDKIANLRLAEKGVLSMLGGGSPISFTDAIGSNGPGGEQPAPQGWDAHALLASETAREFLSTWQSQASGSIRANLGQLAAREDVVRFFGAVDSTEKQGAIPADRRGIVQPQLRDLTLLDLIPFGTTDSNAVEYVQITSIPRAARPTAEGTTKPEASMTTRDVSAPVRTIPAFIKLNKQALDDVAGLGSLINSLLPYDVKNALETQILLGDGTGQNLTGLLNTSGIGEPAPVVGDNTADAILRAITVILLTNGRPNFVALNPLVWQDLLLMRENQEDRTGMYLYGSPSAVHAQQIWGLRITANAAVPVEQSLVGDGNGAMVLVREGINVRVTDTDVDDFQKNRITVRAEGRFAFPVWRPGSFAVAATGSTGS